ETKGDRAAWRRLLHWPSSCETAWRGQSGAGIAGVWPVGGGRHIVAVDCSLGAYQGTSMLFLLDASGRASGPLLLPIYVDKGSGKPQPTDATVVLGTLTFSRGSGILAVRDLARGVGDCGIYSTFKLRNIQLIPLASRAKACDGKPPLDPARWPKLPRLE